MILDDSPSQEIGSFFDTIWQKTEGYVYLPIRNPISGEWKKVFYEWPLRRDNVIRHALKAAASGNDVYMAPAIFRIANPQTENVLGSNVLWADFDGNAPETWEPNTLEPGTTPHSNGTGVPEPTIRIQSSIDGHEHVYWRLSEFCDDLEWIEGANRSIAYSLNADTSGWDRNQILRPPSTVNFKHDLPVTVIRNDRLQAYSNGDFQSLKSADLLVSDSITESDLPDIGGIVAKYRWDDEHYDLFRRTVEKGSRSTALMRLGYFCCEAGMTDSEAYAVLLDVDDRWGKYKDRDDRKKRLLNIINRARQKHPVGTQELTFRGLLGPVESELGTDYVYGFKDFLASDVEVSWLIENLLEQGGLGMVASKPGVGKTQWSIQMGISCALGIPFLGWVIPTPLKVMFLSLEMSHVALKLFMTSISTGYDEEHLTLLQENFTVVAFGEVLPFDRPEGMVFLNSLLSNIKPDLIIVDALGKTTMKELNEATSRDLNRLWGQVRREHNCALWMIHHNRKETAENKKPTELSDVYGNVYLTTDMTSVVILWPDKTDRSTIEVIPVKSRLAALREPFKTTRDNTLKFSLAGSNPEPTSGLKVGETHGDGI